MFAHNALRGEETGLIMARSRAFLELTEPGNEWVTSRPYEALKFGKKLITNNRRIKEEKIYHPDNIFIWGEDPDDKLVDFLNGPLHPMPADVEEYCTNEAFIKRFFEVCSREQYPG